jgi:hypothetical protein
MVVILYPGTIVFDTTVSFYTSDAAVMYWNTASL